MWLARDTKIIADKSVEQIAKSAEQINVSIQQTENAQRPFIALVCKLDNAVRPHAPGGWVIENQGFGPAVNVKHSDDRGQKFMVDTAPLAKGDFQNLHHYDQEMIEAQGFTITYESLGEVSYATVITCKAGAMRVRFCTGLKSAPLPGEFFT